MRLVDFIFTLISRFVPIAKTELIQLQTEADKWYNEKVVMSENKIGQTAKNVFEHWGFRTFLAVIFIFAVKWVSDIINGKPEYQDSEDDE